MRGTGKGEKNILQYTNCNWQQLCCSINIIYESIVISNYVIRWEIGWRWMALYVIRVVWEISP